MLARSVPWFRLLFLFAISIIASSRLHAQSLSAPFGGYHYDSAFYLGGHGIPDVEDGQLSLHLSFSQLYDWPILGLNRLLTTNIYAWDQDSLAPYDVTHGRYKDTIYFPNLGYGQYDGKRHPVNQTVAYNDSVMKKRLLKAQEIGFKFIYTPALFGAIGYRATKSTTYYMKTDPGIFAYGVDTCNPGKGHFDWLDAKQLIGIYTVPAAANDTACIAFRPRFMDHIMQRSDSGIYNRLHAIDTSIHDMSTWFNVAFTIKTDTTILKDVIHPIDDDAVIAFAVLYRRVHDGQRGYQFGAPYIGSIYAKIDTFKITKHMYLTRELGQDAGDGYRTFSRNLELGQYGIVNEGGHPTINKSFFGNPDEGSSDPGTPAGHYIDTLFHRLRDVDSIIPADSYYQDEMRPYTGTEVVEESDFHWRFYTTRIVPVTFLRGRVAQHLLTLLEAGTLDTLLRQEVNSLYSHPDVLALTLRLGILDEANPNTFGALGPLSRTVQRMMREHDDTTHSLWINPQLSPDGCRVLTNDLDSTSTKTIPMIARQSYAITHQPLPITYANPDKMGYYSTQSLYEWGSPVDTLSIFRDSSGYRVLDTIIHFNRWILTNSETDYKRYTEDFARGFGAFADYNSTQPDFIKSGPFLAGTARAVDVSRFKFKSRYPDDPSHSVWNVVQTLAGVNINEKKFTQWRISTPEELICEAWLSVGAGCSGLVFGDFQMDGGIIGVVNSHTLAHDKEYDTIYESNRVTPPTNPADRIDSTWVGEVTRYAAVKEVTGDIHRIDSIIGWKNLEYNQNEMSLFDSRQSFATMPMLDTVKVERAVPTDTAFTAYGSPHYDPRDSAYMEITYFKLKGSNTPLVAGSSVVPYGAFCLQFCNRRLWPIDFNIYNASDTMYGGSTTGLGNIDVRRPVIVLKNMTGVIADSFSIRRVGDS